MGTNIELVLQLMHFMSDHKGLYPEARRASAQSTNTRPAMAVSQDGFHGTFAHVKRLQLSISRNQLIYIAVTPDTYDYMHDFKTSLMVILHGDRKTAWDARVHHNRPGSKIHFQILEGIILPHGDKTPHVYFIPSADRWSDRVGKLLHQPSVAGTSPQQPKGLGRALPNGRICAQQKHECKYRVCALQTQLQVYPAVWAIPPHRHNICRCETVRTTSVVECNDGT